MKQVSSRSNPLYKSLAKLKDSPRERRTEKSALLDGVHLLEAYIEQRHRGLELSAAVRTSEEQGYILIARAPYRSPQR